MTNNKFPDFIEELATKVDGKNSSQDILTFTLSTCQWCKKCKRYLNDRDIEYRYVDVDQITPEQKGKILNFLRENYENRISYPFMICDGMAIVGYNPNKYDEVLKQ